ncbi:ethanolamine ammonia-lyase subunit EutC [Phreatobacter aquaticus]|uniref:Ethanolamine ammonia-lyase small subunit n=1 Tax=Phreatobacter aquaticus TaxID=2570229 RepID=A0A4D7QLA2_9HYPH|nr:ethanolamine ammonia-lyase subunit EutC [Phreatobacter aquaticus]QCK88398.1 ethanolamine ammonia-lyase subunit EutC [Phreatobacter aquaticus]
MTSPISTDSWRNLGVATPARIALGRAGPALPTAAVLEFAMAHARARDAVHAVLDRPRLDADIDALGLACLHVCSAAASRDAYLVRPDLGRRLAPGSHEHLVARLEGPVDIALIVADGLSAHAVQSHAPSMLGHLLPAFAREGWSHSALIVAHQGRVALGDEIGELCKARITVMMIGERPGLSSPDSLGLYLTFSPRIGRHDGERNCISNVRGGGLGYEVAAFKAVWLIREALSRQLTGVALKDESDALLPSRPADVLP